MVKLLMLALALVGAYFVLMFFPDTFSHGFTIKGTLIPFAGMILVGVAIVGFKYLK